MSVVLPFTPHRFALGKPFSANLSDAQRYAVLSPLKDPLSIFWASNMPKSLHQALHNLRHLWWDRLSALRDAGWATPQKELDFKFMCNCPPFSVKPLNGYPRACNRPLVCPFCWARRYVAKGFKHLEASLYLGDNKKPRDYRLLEFSRVYEAGVLDWDDPVQRAACLAEFPAFMRATRAECFGARPCSRVAAVSFFRFLPLQPQDVRIIHSGLILTAAKHQSRDFSSLVAEVRWHKDVNKGTLAEACGRVFRCQAAAWTAPIDITLELMNALAGAAIIKCYNAARGRKEMSQRASDRRRMENRKLADNLPLDEPVEAPEPVVEAPESVEPSELPEQASPPVYPYDEPEESEGY